VLVSGIAKGLSGSAKAAAADVAGAGSSDVLRAGSIRNVNPNFPAPGFGRNCVNCAIATDRTLAGMPSCAMPTKGSLPISVIESLYGGKFSGPLSAQQIEAGMLNAQNGARGIVFGNRGPGVAGHVFNVVNQRGTVRFLDGQIGAPANLKPYLSLHLIRTN
jgi:hypothetical protein